MPRVQEVPLDFAHLQNIDDGKVDALLRFHLQRVAQDCQNRPGDKTKRKVTLEFSAMPVPDESGEAFEAYVQIEVKSKLPVHRTKAFAMRLGRNGFAYNQDFPEDLDQPSLFPQRDDEKPDEKK